MKDFFLQFFTWWHQTTLATRFFTWRKGEKVGEDALGNVYYRGDGKRWVVYAGAIEPSQVPAGWHGWLHGRTDITPTEEEYKAKDWELPHTPNYTGTAKAYAPKGGMTGQEKHPDKVGDYEAWTP